MHKLIKKINKQTNKKVAKKQKRTYLLRLLESLCDTCRQHLKQERIAFLFLLIQLSSLVSQVGSIQLNGGSSVPDEDYDDGRDDENYDEDGYAYAFLVGSFLQV